MSAVFTGNGLGLVNSSLTQLGGVPDGSAGAGPGADRQYVNLANGNLLLQRQDEFLTFRGLGVGLNRTYNSLGQASDVGTDGWVTGFERHVALVSGSFNASGSVVRRYTGDGGYQDFTYVAANTYQSTAGDGAHDTLAWSSTDSTWTWTEGTTRSQEQYANHADATLQGRLLKLKSLKSDGVTPAVWNVIYNAGNQIVEIRADDGTSTGDALLFTYDGNGRLTGVSTRENGATRTQVAYGYDAQGRLITVTTDLTPADASDNTWNSSSPLNDGRLFRTTYTYEGTSLRIASLRQSDGGLVGYTYDASGRVKTVTHGDTNTDDTDGAGETITYTYGTGSTTATDSLGRIWTYAFDGNGQLTQITSPAVSGQSDVTTYQYDAAGNVTQVKAVRGATVLSQKDYQYDAQGNVIKEWDVAGDAIARTFSTTNQILSETRYTGIDPDGTGPVAPTGGVTTTYVYDAQDRLRFIRDQLGFVTEIAYAVGGNGIGQQSSIRTYLGAAYNGSYTEADMAAWATAAQKGNSTLGEFSYDAWGRLSQRVDYATVDGNNGVGVLDAGTGVTRYTYDAQGLLRQQIVVHGTGRSLGGATPSGSEVTDFAYDGLGRLLSVTASVSGAVNTDANTVQTTYVYTDSGMKIVTTSDAGVTRTETRNAAGRLLSVNEVGLGGNVGGGMQSRPTTYTYDSAGQLRIVQDAGGGRSFRFYDAEGRLEETVDATGAVVRMSYDGAGRVVQTRAYANRVATTGWTSVATLPADISAIGIAVNDGLDHVVATTYDMAGRVATVTDGLASDANRSITTYAYDGRGQLLQSVQTDSAGTQATARTTRYFYDDAGNKTGALDAEGYLTELQYDRAGRLVSTIGYSVAAPANLLATGTLAQLRPATDAGKQVTRYYYNGRGQLTGTLDGEMFLTEYVRDDAGNTRAERRYATVVTVVANDTLDTLRAKAGSTYRESRMAYNGLGQLVTETNAEGTVTRYTYDEAGRLVKTEVAQGTSEVREDNLRYNAFGELIGELGGEGSPHLQAGMTDAQLDAVYAQYGVRHSYDALGRRIESVDAAGNKTWYVYDASGRQTFQIRGVAGAGNVPNGAGEVTETRYNAFGQVQDSIAYTGRIAIATPGDRASVLQAVSTLQYVAASDSRRQFTYDTRGLLASLLDANGYLTRYGYNSFGQLKTQTGFRDIAQTQSEVTAYAYDRLGRLLATTESSSGIDAQTRTSTQTWDAFNRVSISDGRGSVASYTYDRLGRQVTSSRTVSGSVEQVRMAYDAYGRVTSQFDAALNETKFAYSDAARSVTVTSPEGVTVTTVHNAFGQTQTVTNGLNQVTTYAYDHDGHLLSTKDALLASATNEYDVRGLLHRTIDATGRIVELNYDAAGRVLTRVVDPNGLALKTTYAYDGQGRQIQVTDPSGVVTAMKYDLAGQLVEATVDPSGLALKTTYAWDGLGRQLTVTEGAGSAVPHTVAYAYDGLGRRVAETVDPNGLALKTTYAYDANDNLATRTDALGNVTRYAFDEANRLRFVVDATGAVTETVYDKNGNIVLTRDYAKALSPTGLAGLSSAPTVAALQALITSESLKNDAADQLAYRVLDRDNRVRFTLDAVGTLTEVRYDTAGRVQQTLAYSTAFTTAAVLTKLRSGTAVVADFASFVSANEAAARASLSVYDAAGRVVYTLVRSNATQAIVSERRYDSSGRVIADVAYAKTIAYVVGQTTAQVAAAMTAAGGDAAGQQRLTRYAYDAAGRLCFTVDDAGGVTEQRYDAAGRVGSTYVYATAVNVTTTPMTVADVAALVSGQGNARRTGFAYDGAGRLASTTDALYQTETYGYDAVGQRISVTNRLGATRTYEYDAAGRLTAERSPVVNVARYDTNGNIVVNAVSIVTRRTYDALGNVLTVTENADTADARTTSYQYDARGRQVRTTFPDAWQLDANGVLAATGVQPQINVTYDALDRAVVQKDVRGNYSYKVYDSQGQLAYDIDDAGYVTAYTYDTFGEQSGLTRFANKMDFTKLPGWGTGQAITLAQIGAAGVLVASGDDRTLTTSYDQLGRKTAVTQPVVSYVKADGTTASGSPTSQFVYDAYGNLVKERVLLEGTPGQADAVWADTFHYYDDLGHMVRSVDAEGYVTAWQYDAIGQVGIQVEFARKIDTATLAVGVLPPQPAAGDASTGYDRSVAYQYDVLGRKVAETAQRLYQSSTGASGMRNVTTNFGYDAEGHLTSTTIDGVVDSQLVYDALGHVSSSTETQRKVLRSDWQSAIAANASLDLSSAALYVDASPYTTMEYDAFGNVVRVVRYADGKPAVGAPNAGNAANATTTTRYDRQGRAVITRDAAGTAWYSRYDAADHVLDTWYTLSGSSGNATVHTIASYDEIGRQLTTVTSRLPNGGSTVIDAQSAVQYNAFGEITAKGDTAAALASAATSARYAYDKAGRVTASNAETGTTRSYFYNLAGYQQREERPWTDGATASTAVYLTRTDKLGRVVAQVLPSWKSDAAATAQVSVVLDRWGNALRQVDARGYVTENAYNDRNQLIRQLAPRVKVVDEAGNENWLTPETLWMYDALGRRIAVRDANNHIQRYTYDAAGQLVAATDATLAVTRQGYDAMGRGVAAQDAIGHMTYVDYDGLDRATAQGDFMLNVAGAPRTKTVLQSFSLNQNGDRLQVTDATGHWNLFDYDSRGLLVRSQTQTGVVHTYLYDAQGRKTRDVDGIGGVNAWTYDYFGRLTDHSDLGNADYDYAYDSRSGLLTEASSNRTVTVTPQGGRFDDPDVTDALEGYDITQQVFDRKTGYYANGQVRQVNDANIFYYYEYDAAGNRTLEETKTVDGQGMVVHTITRTTYDSNNRISRVTTQDMMDGGRYTLDLTYDYDAVGNRRRVVANSAYGPNASPLDVGNKAPVLAGTIQSGTVKSGSDVQWTLDAASYFNDPDGTPLGYVLTLANGNPLPSWLQMSYDAATNQLRFHATAGSAAALGQSFVLRLTATDSPTQGSPLSVSTDFTLSVVANTAPTAKAAGTLNVYAKNGYVYTQEFAVGDYFLDPDIGDSLALSVDPLAAGLSSWLSVDTSTPGVVRLSGTPPQVGTYTLTLRARDGSNAEATKVVQLQVVAAQGPMPKTVPTKTVTDQHAFVLEWASTDLFTDTGGFSIAASLPNGAPLPAWMGYQYLYDEVPPKFRLTGTPPAGSADQSIQLTATNADGMSSSLTFLLHVTPNQGPQAMTGTLNETARSGTAYTRTWSAASLFSDPEGDALTYSLVATDSRAQWLGFSATGGNIKLWGTPAESQVGSYSVTVRATDAFGLSKDIQVAFVVASSNNAPTVATPIPDQTANATGGTWSYVFPAGTFVDPDGGALTYSASGMPGWMAFNASTRTFSGVPSVVGSWNITVTASDPQGALVSDTFTVTTPNVAPIVSVLIPDQAATAGQAWSYVVPAATFADRNGQTLTYSATGMPAWMTFNAATRTFSGTGAAAGSWNITVTASDGSLSVSDTFKVSVANVAPIVVNPVPGTQAAMVGTPFSYTLPANTFSDANGDALTYSVHHWVEYVEFDPHTNEPSPYWEDQLPAWLNFNPTTRQFSGTPTYQDNIDLEIWATDPSGLSAVTYFTLVVATAPPVVSTPIPDQTANATGGTWSYVIPAGSFTDPDGGALTYSASGMPGWMAFNASTRTFTGTPSTIGSWNITVTAQDPSGASVSDTFVVTTPNAAPYIVTAIPDKAATVGQAFSYTFPAFGDRNGQALSYTLSGQPAWLAFDAATRTLSGTPTATGTYTLTVTASDGSLTASNSFTLTVSNVPVANRAPIVNRALEDQEDGLDYTFAADTFIDPDGDPLTYTYTVSPLAPGVTFNPATRTFSGSASGGKYGKNYIITVIANDGQGHTASSSFNFYVSGYMDPLATAPASTDLYDTMAISQQQMVADQQAMQAPVDPPDDPPPGGGGGTPPPTTSNTQTLWFTYDAANRVQVVNGALVNGQIVVATLPANAKVASYALHYDAAGHAVNRITNKQNANGTSTTQVTQSTYDQRGQLELEYATVDLGAATGVVAKHTYDNAGREIDRIEYFAPGTSVSYHVGNPKINDVEYYDVDVSGWKKHETTTTYDNDGRVLSVSEFGRSSNANALWAASQDPALVAQSTVSYTKANGASGYDAAGRLTDYRYTNITGGYTHSYVTSYEARDTYLESSVYGSSSNPNFRPTTTSSTYDSMGRRTAIVQNTPYNGQWITQGRYFSFNGSGNILTRRDGSLDAYGFHESANTRQYYSYVNGQQVATQGIDGSIDAASQLTAFDSSETGTASTLVLEGDTLQSIAQRVYGNSSLWYVLAAANAINSNADLVAGTTLKAPEVKTTANDASTYKPYNPNAIEGPTTPSLPYIQPPPKQHCNAMAAILMVVVAVVVIYFTAGVAAGWFAPAGSAVTGGTMAAGGAALSGGAIATTTAAGLSSFTLTAGQAFVVGAVAGAAGSVASQAVGSAMGVSEFSWKNVAVGALTGGIGASLSTVLAASSTFGVATKAIPGTSTTAQLTTAGRVLQGIGTYAGSVVANSIVGNPSGFSWKGVAASAIGSYASATLGGRVSAIQGGGSSGSFFKDLAGSFVAGASMASARRLMGLGKQDWDQIEADAFGNALGNAIVGGINDWRQNQALKEKLGSDRYALLDKYKKNSPERLTAQSIMMDMDKNLSIDDVQGLVDEGITLAQDENVSIDDRKDYATRLLRSKVINGEHISDGDLEKTIHWAFDPPKGSVVIGEMQSSSPNAEPAAAPYEQNALDNLSDVGQQSLQNYQKEHPVLGLYAADQAAITIGGSISYVANKIEANPWLKWGLVALDAASGPAMFAVRTAVMASPVGTLVQNAMEGATEFLADKFANSGYSGGDSVSGALGIIGAVGIAAIGAVGFIKSLGPIQRLIQPIASKVEAITARVASKLTMKIGSLASSISGRFGRDATRYRAYWDNLATRPYTLSTPTARAFYLTEEDRIPSLLDRSLPLENQAKQAFDMRNELRTRARELMSDRQLAESLNRTDPNMTWAQILNKYSDYSGDALWNKIIETSTHSRKSVNKNLGF